MEKKRIAVLYIATGKYILFWKEFFESSEQYFLTSNLYEKHYFVFTDAEEIEYSKNPRIHTITQESLAWPFITLDRFSIFQKARSELETMDYIYFFNGNMLFLCPIDEEILPTEEQPLVMVQHPGYFNKKRTELPYESAQNSLAHIAEHEGKTYFMGGLNGGKKEEYLALIDELEDRVNQDKINGVIAIWHDESQLNRYAIDFQDRIKVLYPSYGYPQGIYIPFPPKIMIRDKSRYGGHNFLRNDETKWKKYIKRILKW